MKSDSKNLVIAQIFVWNGSLLLILPFLHILISKTKKEVYKRKCEQYPSFQLNAILVLELLRKRIRLSRNVQFSVHLR